MTTGKTPSKKKIPKIKELKKPLIIGAIAVVVAIAGIAGGIYVLQETPKGGTCIIGVDIKWKIVEIDPLTTLWEGAMVTQQVAETLFDNDFSSEESKISYTLATDYTWNDNATELTCSLRQGVKFHDGTPFNAEAVKWNFDRMYHLVNTTLGSMVFSFGYLVILPDGRWIVNETQVIDEYTVKFVLNEPFVPFLQLLTHSATSILSPTSTVFDEILNFLTDDIVGTGPFIYDEYILDVEIKLSPNPSYWGGKPKIDGIIIRYYDTTDDLWNAFLAQNVTFLLPVQTSSFFIYFPNKSIEMLINDPKITVQESLGTNFRYIGMNNININVTMRKAISHAFNYSILTEEWPIISMRVRSPIPEGIIYSNTTAFNIPNYNISLARQTLLDANWPGTAGLSANNNVSAGNEWETLVSNDTSLETYNISYWAANAILSFIAPIVRENLRQIGISVNLIGSDMKHWANHLFISGWLYDYNDPHSALYPLYSSKSSDNMVYGSHLNDSLVDQWIEEAAKDTNPVTRKETYYKIQERLIEELYVSAWTFTSKTIDIYDSNLRGWQPNPLKYLYKTVYFV